jgi:hypothetical protein
MNTYHWTNEEGTTAILRNAVVDCGIKPSHMAQHSGAIFLQLHRITNDIEHSFTWEADSGAGDISAHVLEQSQISQTHNKLKELAKSYMGI